MDIVALNQRAEIQVDNLCDVCDVCEDDLYSANLPKVIGTDPTVAADLLHTAHSSTKVGLWISSEGVVLGIVLVVQDYVAHVQQC
jgi:hypothetical protein